jgi:hypothetical protein
MELERGFFMMIKICADRSFYIITIIKIRVPANIAAGDLYQSDSKNVISPWNRLKIYGKRIFKAGIGWRKV